MQIVNLSIRRPILITMFLLVFVVLGLFSYFDLPIDLLPSTNIPIITVSTIYPGANPEEVKNTVTRVIEDAVSSLPGLKRMTSYSMENISILTIEFRMGNDVDIMAQDVREKINAIKYKLPDAAKEPFVLKIDINDKPIIDLILTGPYPVRQLYRLADEELKDELGRIDGVASVRIIGGQKRIVRVELDRDKLQQYQLNIDDVVKFIKANNLDIPGGSFDKGRLQYSLRVTGKAEAISRLGDIVIVTKFGSVKLHTIARIRDSFEKPETRTLFWDYSKPQQKGYSSVGISVMRQTGANTIRTAAEILLKVDEMNRTKLPPQTHLFVFSDRSDFIKASVADTLMNILAGILLTALVLIIFLHNYRSTIIAVVVIPISYLSVLFFIQRLGYSLNMFTLAAFSVTIGALVSNTVIVIENITRFLKEGHEPAAAAELGTKEIALAVVATTLTNVVVFVPIAMMRGMVGQMFAQFGITVTIVTILSLIVSFTMTPMMASRMLNRDVIDKRRKFGHAFDRFFARVEAWYGRQLDGLVRSGARRTVMLLTVFVLFAAALFAMRFAGNEFIATMDQGFFQLQVQFPVENNLQQTEKYIRQVEKVCAAQSNVVATYAQLGIYNQFNKGSNVAKVWIKIKPKQERREKIGEIVNQLRVQLTDIPGAEFSLVKPLGFGPDMPVLRLRLLGSDMDSLKYYAARIKSIMEDVPGCVDVIMDYKTGRPEVRIIPDLNKIADYGLTVYHVAMAVRGSVQGIVASTFREMGREYDIKVNFASAGINDPQKIASIPIATNRGIIRLRDVARIEMDRGPTRIVRQDRTQMIGLTANVSERSLGEIVDEIKQKIETMGLPPGYTYSFLGDMEFYEDARADITKAAILATILTFVILCALLESFVHPLIIMGTLPLSLIGVVPALLLTGTTINLTSMIAMVMLIGIVVNNGILLIDYISLLRRQGKSLDEAVVKACPVKLRPILMSALAIMFGMLPLAWASGAGSEARAPIGVVSIGGLLVATFLTLFVIPTVYKIYEEKKKG